MIKWAYIFIAIVFFNCKTKSQLLNCDHNLIVLNSELNLELNQCIDLKDLENSKGKYGAYTIFAIECENFNETSDFIQATSFDLENTLNRSILSANIVFLQVGMEKDVEFKAFCRNKLKYIFSCVSELNGIPESIDTLNIGISNTFVYNKTLFNLKYEDKNTLILNIQNN